MCGQRTLGKIYTQEVILTEFVLTGGIRSGK